MFVVLYRWIHDPGGKNKINKSNVATYEHHLDMRVDPSQERGYNGAPSSDHNFGVRRLKKIEV